MVAAFYSIVFYSRCNLSKQCCVYSVLELTLKFLLKFILSSLKALFPVLLHPYSSAHKLQCMAM